VQLEAVAVLPVEVVGAWARRYTTSWGVLVRIESETERSPLGEAGAVWRRARVVVLEAIVTCRCTWQQQQRQQNL
jgi:hypothetical protein